MEKKKLKKLELKKSNEISFLTEGELSEVKGGFPFWLIGLSFSAYNAAKRRFKLDSGATNEDYRRAFEGTTGVSYDFYTYGM